MATSMTNKVILDIGGQRFVTTSETLKSLPKTKLGQLVSSSNNNEAPLEFYFDRNSDLFRFIMDYYRTGELHMPLNVCVPAFKNELDFWQVNDQSLMLCYECNKKYLGESDDEKAEVMETFSKLEYVPIPPNCKTSLWRKGLWLFLEDSSSSRWAKLPGVVYLLMCTLSIVCTLLDTVESIRGPEDPSKTVWLKNNTDFIPSPKLRPKLLSSVNHVLFYAHVTCVVYFAIDFFVRFAVCPFRKKFFKSFFNILDLVIVLSMLAELLVGLLFDPSSLVTEYAVVICFLVLDAVVRIFMVIRLLKFVRHHVGLKVLFLTIKSSLPVCGILISFMIIATLLFAFLIYITSITDDTYFPNIFYGMWWAIITMTTVGYGDMYPVTPGGYVVGVLCALTGLMLTALPIAVLGNSFNTYLQYAKEYEMMKKRKTKGVGVKCWQIIKDRLVNKKLHMQQRIAIISS